MRPPIASKARGRACACAYACACACARRVGRFRHRQLELVLADGRGVGLRLVALPRLHLQHGLGHLPVALGTGERDRREAYSSSHEIGRLDRSLQRVSMQAAHMSEWVK
jgi:hypothetical protein